MDFEFDPEKSEINRQKHGIDFEEARELWKDQHLAEIDVVKVSNESRILVIGIVRKKYWTSVITNRGTKIRIISVRRSRKKEIEIYEGRRIR